MNYELRLLKNREITAEAQRTQRIIFCFSVFFTPRSLRLGGERRVFQRSQ